MLQSCPVVLDTDTRAPQNSGPTAIHVHGSKGVLRPTPNPTARVQPPSPLSGSGPSLVPALVRETQRSGACHQRPLRHGPRHEVHLICHLPHRTLPRPASPLQSRRPRATSPRVAGLPSPRTQRLVERSRWSVAAAAPVGRGEEEVHEAAVGSVAAAAGGSP